MRWPASCATRPPRRPSRRTCWPEAPSGSGGTRWPTSARTPCSLTHPSISSKRWRCCSTSTSSDRATRRPCPAVSRPRRTRPPTPIGRWRSPATSAASWTSAWPPSAFSVEQAARQKEIRHRPRGNLVAGRRPVDVGGVVETPPRVGGVAQGRHQVQNRDLVRVRDLRHPSIRAAQHPAVVVRLTARGQQRLPVLAVNLPLARHDHEPEAGALALGLVAGRYEQCLGGFPGPCLLRRLPEAVQLQQLALDTLAATVAIAQLVHDAGLEGAEQRRAAAEVVQ